MTSYTQSNDSDRLEASLREKIKCRNESFIALCNYLDDMQLFPKDINAIILSALYEYIGEINPYVAYLLNNCIHGDMNLSVWHGGDLIMFISYNYAFQRLGDPPGVRHHSSYTSDVSIDDFWQFIMDGNLDDIVKMYGYHWTTRDRVNLLSHIHDSKFIDGLRKGLTTARNEILYPRVRDDSADSDDGYGSDR